MGLDHLRRLLDVRLPLDEITPRHIQEYVTARAQVVATETVRKEVGTFMTIWNRLGGPAGDDGPVGTGNEPELPEGAEQTAVPDPRADRTPDLAAGTAVVV